MCQQTAIKGPYGEPVVFWWRFYDIWHRIVW